MKGKISISRVSGSEGEYVAIEFVDESSGVYFLEAKLSLVDFARALMGLSGIECEFELRSDYVGFRREVKEENVLARAKTSYRLTGEEITAALAPYEVDGWQGQRSQVGNHYRRVSIGDEGDMYRVTFVRYVK